MDNKSNKSNKNVIRKILLVVCIIILLVSVGILINFFLHKEAARQTVKSYEELAAEVNNVSDVIDSSKTDKESNVVSSDAINDKDNASDKTNDDKDNVSETTDDVKEEIKKDPNEILKTRGIEIPQKNLNWDELHQINPDIYAWLYVPGTVIDYPVLQRADDNQYYLMRNLDGSEGFPGCIFTETYSKKDFSSKNNVLYGHNMLDGSMFASLLYFLDKAFFDENRFVFIYTPDGDYVYEIFAAYYDDDKNLSLAYDYSKDEYFEGYLYRILSLRDMRNHFLPGYKPDGASHIVTLSTCVDAVSDGARYMIAGVMLNDPYVD